VLLARASGGAADPRWTQPLAAARFYAGLGQARAARDAGRLADAEALARTLAASGHPDSALASALAEDAAHERGRLAAGRAVAALRTGDTVAADQAYQLAVAAAPRDAWIRYGYASLLADTARPEAADLVMQPLAGIDAPEVRYALALYLDRVGRPAEAADQLEAIAPAAQTADMRRFARQLRCELAVRAARTLAGLGRRDAAVAGLRRLAGEEGLSNAALSQLSDGLFELGAAADAQAVVDRVRAAPLTVAGDYEGAVSVLGRAGQPDVAKALIDDLAQSGASPAEVARLRARLALGSADRFSRQGALDKAEAVLKAQIAVSGEDPELLAALGRAYTAAGQPAKALTVLQRLAALRPKDDGAALQLASAATAARALDAAGAALGRAASLSAEPGYALASAELDHARGADASAAATLRQALDVRDRLQAGDPMAALDPRLASRTRDVFAVGPLASDARDPAGEAMRRRLEVLNEAVYPALKVRVAGSEHTGDRGLSRLDRRSVELAAVTPLGRGRLEIAAGVERLDAGAARPGAAARFGAGPLAPASGAPGRTEVKGARLVASYTTGALSTEAEIMAFRGRPAAFAGAVRWSPRLTSDLQGDFAFERRPVTDSLTAFAGAEDPRAGLSWGQVSRTGARAGLTLTHADRGIYGVVAAHAYDGRRVRGNASAQLDVGGFARLAGKGETQLTGGLNLDLQTYRRNENIFTYGHGGYFSPQRFASLTAPLRFKAHPGRWQVQAELAPGVQSFREGGAPVFPTAPGLQTQLPPDRQRLDGSHKRGLGVSGEASVGYELTPAVLVGFDAGADTFGAYHERHATLRLRVRYGQPR
jgi:tetratricopeptide (TPR) repeat protein